MHTHHVMYLMLNAICIGLMLFMPLYVACSPPRRELPRERAARYWGCLGLFMGMAVIAVPMSYVSYVALLAQ
jgi:hypothetical protein